MTEGEFTGKIGDYLFLQGFEEVFVKLRVIGTGPATARQRCIQGRVGFTPPINLAGQAPPYETRNLFSAFAETSKEVLFDDFAGWAWENGADKPLLVGD